MHRDLHNASRDLGCDGKIASWRGGNTASKGLRHLNWLQGGGHAVNFDGNGILVKTSFRTT
jgi:hypothetical protein